MYVEVVVRSKARYADKLFTYRLPGYLEDQVKIGHRLSVPMGRSDKPIEAFVFNIRENISETYNAKYNKNVSIDSEKEKKEEEIEKEYDSNIKDIIDVLDEEPMLSKDNIRLIYWMRKRYMCTFVDCINLFYPKGYKSESRRMIGLGKESYEMFEDFYEDENNLYESYRYKDVLKKSDLETYRDLKKIIVQLCRTGHENVEECLVDFEDFLENRTKASVGRLLDTGLARLEWIYIENRNEKKVKFISLSIPVGEVDTYIFENKIRLGSNQEKLIDFLKINHTVEMSDLVRVLNISSQSIKSMLDKGLICIEERDYYRNHENSFRVDDKAIILNEGQKGISDYIKSNSENKAKRPYLLHGVTGSGKTEVYLDLIEYYLKEGMDSIFLVPEIALTPQMISRVKNRFGNIVGVFHSQLSVGEKHDVYRQIKKGNIRILVGTRSSIFMPFRSLGLIIVDEEHDSSYKSEMTPKYDTLEVARAMAENQGISLVMGSATPKVSDYYRAKIGDYELLELNQRANNMPMPEIELVDMRKSFVPNHNRFLSDYLFEGIKKTIEDGNQVILFLNRRGYANFVTCKECGYVFKCGNCDISLTYHKSSNRGVCHYCGHEEKIPKTCPQCGGMHISSVGTGTQRIEEEIIENIENVRVLRIDKDTTSKKGDLETILTDFQEGRADILIGTQIITKGHDFDNVTLVGIVSADMMLNYPDYTASEMTFQLVTQVAGRSGRGKRKGRVILQTYDTQHFAIQTACAYDYSSFFDKEIALRKTFGYEPFNNMLRLVFSGNNYKKVKYNAEKFYESILYLIKSQESKMLSGNSLNDSKDMYEKIILGPSECSINRINSKYRWQVVIKDRYLDINIMKNMVKYLCISKFDDIFDKDIQISIEVNPNSYI